MRSLILILLAGSAFGQNSFFNGTAVPKIPDVTDDKAAVTVGLPFTSDKAGNVTGVAFYKGTKNTGTHVGSLWSSKGALLGSVTFSAETASGWQKAAFAKPIAITAATVYTISVFDPKGNYADDQNFKFPIAAPLHVSGASGTFAYGSKSAFPNGTWNKSNYYVDVLFTPSGVTPPPPPGNSVSLTWGASPSSNIAGYYVYRSGQSTNYANPMNSTPTTSLSFSDPTVIAGETYYYIVRAVNKAGLISSPSNEVFLSIPKS